MSDALTVLIVDDDAGDRALCRKALRSGFGESLTALEADTGESGLDCVESNPLDCVLLDYSLPGINGVDVLRRIRVTHPYLPVVMIDGKGNDRIAVLSMQEGAQDYIAKSTITPSTLQRAVTVASEHSALQKQAHRLGHALESAMHGLCVFDRNGRLVVCNSRYSAMYGLPPELTREGVPFQSILEWRLATGNGSEREQEFLRRHLSDPQRLPPQIDVCKLRDGRFVLVSNQPNGDGGWVAVHQDITAQKHAEEQVAFMARHDSLTSLPNRVLFSDHLRLHLGALKRDDALAVLFLDLDQFKQVNDTLGHNVGDELLCAVGSRLKKCVGENDIVSRLGGDEFAVLQSHVAQPTSATLLAQRIMDEFSRPCEVQGEKIDMGVSIGISVAPDGSAEAEQILRSADIALHRAKERRSGFCFFDAEMDKRMQERRMLQANMREAIERGQFELYYQPIVCLETNTVSGFEALLRWNHPTHGLISPSAFIPFAEETGLIIPLGEWVILTACREAAKWPDHIGVAVNLSPAQFRGRDLVPVVMSAIEGAGIAARRVELEITETMLLQDGGTALAILQRLRSSGIRIVMDDCGTGYSWLSHLRNFPFDKIKIDQTFVRDLGRDKTSIALVRAMLSIGRDLGITTTVEGVETEEQLRTVQSEGCTEVQGYLFSKPQPAREVPRLLSTVTSSCHYIVKPAQYA